MHSTQFPTKTRPPGNRQSGQLPAPATFATQLVNHGLPIGSVRKLLGHQALNMTQHYARMFDTTVTQQFASATEAFEAMLIPDWPVPVTAAPVSSPIVDNFFDSV